MARRNLFTSTATVVYLSEVAPLMGANGPEAEAPSAHCHVRLLTVPSMSVTDAVSSSPPASMPMMVTVPGSSTLERLMVTAMLSSVLVSVLPASSLLSRTFTVTE